MKKSLITCVPKGLPGTPAFSGRPVAVPEMLYIPQWVNEAVMSNRTTTKLLVPAGAFVHESSGDWLPPMLPSSEQALMPFISMLWMVLRGSVWLFKNVVLVTWNWLVVLLVVTCAAANKASENAIRMRIPTRAFTGGPPSTDGAGGRK